MNFEQQLYYWTHMLDEALTIPADKAGDVEIKLRNKILSKEFKLRYPDFQYLDILIKCCRNDEKTGIDQKLLERTYITGLPNIMDMFDVYNKSRASYIRQHLNKKINIERADGKTVSLDPIKDISKIGRLSVLTDFIDKLDKMVNSDSSILTTFEKYAILDDERKDIRLICWNENVMVWGTKHFEPSQKFAVQLWQNIETIDSAGEYGNPEEQCPYCTHARSHWDRHAGKNPDYELFWYLSIPEGFGQLTVGDLNNPNVVKLFNKMKGIGPESICALNDSDRDWCDRDDNPIAEYDLTPADIDEEGTIEVNDPDGDEDDDVIEIDVNFNGFLDDVYLLDKKYFSLLVDCYEQLPWESTDRYIRRYNSAKRNSLTKPISDISDDNKTFDLDKDIWNNDIIIDENSIEIIDGKTVLKNRYPKNIAGDIYCFRINKLDSFNRFPEKYVGNKDSVRILFKDCGQLDFYDFPIFSSEKILILNLINVRMKHIICLENLNC